MTLKPGDMTPLADLTLEKDTGPVRARRPVYVDLLPPCNHACPAGENIQAWLDLAQAGKYRRAWDVLMRDNPLPAVHGRVCYHPRESSCNRQELDAPVSIHAVERYLGDLAAREGWMPTIEVAPSGKRVLIVGSGPSGLSAAYHLTRLGHSVEIHESESVAGGMLHFGIPSYRLPRADLAKEVVRIEAMGVRIVVNHKVTNLLEEKQANGFDAAFVAIGAHISRHVEIPARDAARIVDAVSLLRDVGAGEPPLLGRRVVVYGGNTAMDAARTARRLGAEDAMIVYRRDRAHMPAHQFEADEALSEDVRIKWLTTIKDIAGQSLTVEMMELGPDGFPRPTGRFETLQADAVVLALGQDTDSGFLRNVPDIGFNREGTVLVGPDMMTGAPGIFAGGDMVPGARTVTVAVGHGKLAARNIDAWLRGTQYQHPRKAQVVDYAMLHLPVFSDAAPSAQRELPPAIVGGHVVQFSRQDGTGVLATDAGDIIRFGKEQVEPHVLASLHVGDRAWSMWGAVDGAGKLACAAHGRSGVYGGISRPSVPTGLPNGAHGPG